MQVYPSSLWMKELSHQLPIAESEHSLQRTSMRIVSLFSGIGGFELGLGAIGGNPVLLCENDPAAVDVLQRQFPNVELHGDVTTLGSLPACDMVVAGWPCQDLSQAGRMAGITGSRSGLIDEVFRLLDSTKSKPEFLILENVAFALSLGGGQAISHVTEALEVRGYRWAYRVLDTIRFGLPQRRRRLYILASRTLAPEGLLFELPFESQTRNDLDPTKIGFYWTEGNTGIGWSPDAVPPLKGGSGLSIPSPPAVWYRGEAFFGVPSIEDAERLQGFPEGWTEAAESENRRARCRWKLIGNAVSTPVVSWIGQRLISGINESFDMPVVAHQRGTPNAGFGGPKLAARRFRTRIEGPEGSEPKTLGSFGTLRRIPLSYRAANGFLTRYVKSRLRKDPQFTEELAAYCASLR